MFLIAVLSMVPAMSAVAMMTEEPRSFSLPDKSLERIDRKVLPKLDIERLRAEDRAADKNAARPGPHRFAVAADVSFTPENSGTWQTLPDGQLWRLRIQTPGVTTQNLGITTFDMAEGAKLWIYNPDHKHVEGPYMARHRSRLGSLWTPVIEGEELIVEVFVPAGVARPHLVIGKVNRGYRGFGKDVTGGGGTAGACENDVICPVADLWRDQIRSAGVYTVNGAATCSGTLMNDTAMDRTPYILSANHCSVTGGPTGNDTTVVMYWDYESPTCGTHTPGTTTHNQLQATYRASYAPSDFLLFELAQRPDTLGYNVYYAGWDATGVAPASTVGIHHPQCDVKSISFSNSVPEVTAYWGTTPDPAGRHWRVLWDSGVTEPGSSGSCLFETTNHRCIGQLHGGPSACGAADLHDYYGQLSVSWTGGGTAATRLSDWLDNVPTGVLTLDGDPHVTTANGVHYDFQGGGEYVVLKNASGLEIQTRQAPIATTFNPGPDGYDGLATCVSLNTAVAARVGGHRVTYQPNLSGVPDPSGLQLRLDGVLTTLGSTGMDLGGGGRITRTSVPGGLEIDFPDSHRLLVTPGWWGSQGKWYLNVDVVRAPSSDGIGGAMPTRAASTAAGARSPGGIMGTIPLGSWLPALPDGTVMGPMPEALHQRYVDLYQRFGEAWRVNDRTSLFDYAPGTSTATFTLRSWPPEQPPCLVPGAEPARPVEPAVAEQACARVTGRHAHADCVFDVRVTGHLGFADTYLNSAQAIAVATGGTPGPQPSVAGKLALFLDVGAGFPHGTFSNGFDTGFNLDAGVEVLLHPRLSAEAIFGYHRFPASTTGHLDLYQYSANAKVYLLLPPTAPLRVFVNGGVGAYTLSPGSTYVGGNLGAGISYDLTEHLGLQVSYGFHTVNTPSSATRFSTLQAGLRYAF